MASFVVRAGERKEVKMRRNCGTKSGFGRCH